MTTADNTPAAADIVDRLTAEGLRDLADLAQHYPAAVVETLRDNIIAHLHRRLDEAGLTAEARLLDVDYTVLTQYLDLCPNGQYSAERAAANGLTSSSLAHELPASVGAVLAIMQDTGRLDAWG